MQAQRVGRDMGLHIHTLIARRGRWPELYLLTPWSRVLLEKLTGFAASQEISRIFGTRSSITYSQVPATCPYPEHRSSTHILYFRNQVFPVWNHSLFRLSFRLSEEVQTANVSTCDTPWTELPV